MIETSMKSCNDFRVARLKGLLPGRLDIKGEPFEPKSNLWEQSLVQCTNKFCISLSIRMICVDMDLRQKT